MRSLLPCMRKARFEASVILILFTIGLAQAEESSISLGIPVLGMIGCGESDGYVFSARAQDKILGHVVETSDFGGVCSGVAAFQFDQCVEIFDASGRLLASACAPIESNHRNKYRIQRGPVSIPADGIYRIVVRDGNNRGRGTYTLWLQDTSDPKAFQTLANAIPRLMPIQSPGEVHTFVFNADKNDRIEIKMEPQSGDLIPRLALYSPNGELVALPEGGSVDVVALESGRFTLLAFSAVAETGTYLVEMNTGSSPPSLPDSSIAGPFHLFPQFAAGEGWSTSFLAANVSDGPTTCSVSLNGTVDGTCLLPGHTFTLSGRGSVARLEVAYVAAGGLATGYAAISCDGDIAAWSILRLDDRETGYPLGMATVFSSQSSKESVLPIYLHGGNLGIAFVNDSDETSELQIRLLDEKEELAGLTRISLPPRGHTARFITELLSVPFDSGSNFRGSIRISGAAQPVYLIGFLFDDTVFTTIPAARLAP
ncbi:MAG: hypothetical protein JXA73_05000 [Acidobacteria bacterium]|nr:hypothetical protein [Acidobacteriota bacterium]